MARAIDPHKKAGILGAARRKFAEKGYSQTPMSEIADLAGVAHGTLYLYYPAKEALALALSEEFYTGLGALILPAAAEAASLDAVLGVVEQALDFIAREQDLVRMINLYAQVTPCPQPMPARLEFYRRLSAVFGAQMAAGVICRYDAAVAAELVAGLVEWVAEATVVRGFGDLSRYRATLLAFIRHALTPAPAHE